MGESKAIGRYEKESEGSLLGLAMGMILKVFHILGMVFVLIVMLKRSVKCLMFTLPGPVELLFLDCFIAWVVSVSVIVIGVDVSDLLSLFIIL